jgi:exosortase/archaeosortase family protein
MQVLTLFLLLLRPTNLFQRLTLFSLVALLTPFANILRLLVMGLLAQNRPDLAARLHDTNSWLFTLLLFALTCGLAGRLGIFEPWNSSQPTDRNISASDAEGFSGSDSSS